MPDLIADLIRGAAWRVHPSEHRPPPLLGGAQAAVRSPDPATARLTCRANWMPRQSLISPLASASQTVSPNPVEDRPPARLAGSGRGDDRHGRGSAIVTTQLPIEHWPVIAARRPAIDSCEGRVKVCFFPETGIFSKAHSTVKCNTQFFGVGENLTRGLIAEYLSGTSPDIDGR